MAFKLRKKSTIAGGAFAPPKNSGQRVELAKLTSVEMYEGLTITSIDVSATAFDMKSGDKINIGGQLLTLDADAAAASTTLSVASRALDFEMELNTTLEIDNQNLFVQYQRKTEGTIGGMPVTSDAIGKLEYNGGIYSFVGVDPTYVKILPRDFLVNDDASIIIPPVIFNDGTNTGVSVADTSQELIATVNIPYGTTATEVTIWGSNTTKTVEVYEMNIDANGTGSTIGTGTTNGVAIDITDTAVTTTNYLMIKILVSNVNHRVWGGTITLTQN